MERWALKSSAPEGKNRHCEDVLRIELNGLGKELETLQFLFRELSIRARDPDFKKQRDPKRGCSKTFC